MNVQETIVIIVLIASTGCSSSGCSSSGYGPSADGGGDDDASDANTGTDTNADAGAVILDASPDGCYVFACQITDGGGPGQGSGDYICNAPEAGGWVCGPASGALCDLDDRWLGTTITMPCPSDDLATCACIP